MSDAGGSITQAFNRMRQGDGIATQQIVDRYFPRLASLARKTIAGRPQGMADADDAVQSAFTSFFVRVQTGQYDIEDRIDLWNLLGAITANKARGQCRREATAKRGGGFVLSENDLASRGGSRRPLDQGWSTLPTAEFDLYCEELLSQLDPELREFALMRLFGYRNAEIAQTQACTERKVERKLNLIRLRWKSQLADEGGD